MLDLIEHAVRRFSQGEIVAFCVVVRTRGSTPQSAGAAMLVTGAGHSIGTLGGGCVEAEVRVRAQKLILEKKSRLVSFKLDHDYGWDDGLVCGGIMDIAIQVVDSPHTLSSFQSILNELAANRPANLKISVENEQSESVQLEIKVPPAPRLLIAGAGHVGAALAEIAGRIGFLVTVIDDRPDLLSAARLGNATCIAGEIEAEIARLQLDDNTYCVVVTRGHKHDAQALRAALSMPCRYVGMIGSKRKVRTILDDLNQQGISRQQLAQVHAPIGLEIGAITPQEIAVSIAAELIAVRRGRGNKPAEPMKMDKAALDRWLDRDQTARGK